MGSDKIESYIINVNKESMIEPVHPKTICSKLFWNRACNLWQEDIHVYLWLPGQAEICIYPKLFEQI